MKRRLLFATPFVLVVGCKRPIEATTPGEHDETEEDRAPTYVAASNIDASMAWPTRIDPPDPPDAAPDRVRYTGCGRHPDGTFTTCNPPRPGFDDAGNRTTTGNPPPPPSPSRVLAVEVQGSDLLLRVTNSSTQIDKHWTGTLADEKGRAMPNGTVVIIRVDKSMITVRARVTQDQVRVWPYVRWTPPN